MGDVDPVPHKVICPGCGKLSVYAPENPYRPFCGKRCKLIDLGQWASESYRIPLPADSAEQDGEGASTPG